MNEKNSIAFIIITVCIVCMVTGFIAGKLRDRTTISKLGKQIEIAQEQNNRLAGELTKSKESNERSIAELEQLRNINSELENRNRETKERITEVISSIGDSINNTDSAITIVSEIIRGFEDLKKAIIER